LPAWAFRLWRRISAARLAYGARSGTAHLCLAVPLRQNRLSAALQKHWHSGGRGDALRLCTFAPPCAYLRQQKDVWLAKNCCAAGAYNGALGSDSNATGGISCVLLL